MATKKFIEFCKQCEYKNLSFKTFFDYAFEKQSPVKLNKEAFNKQTINMDGFTMLNLCDCILSNLFLNRSFISTVESKMSFDNLKGFFDLFKAVSEESDTINNNRNVLAKLILYLHMSKSIFTARRLFMFFRGIDSVSTSILNYRDEDEYWFVNVLESFYSNILVNDGIKEMAIDVVKSVTGKSAEYDFSSLRLEFFKCNIVAINGYAGMNVIYVSIDALQSFLFSLSENFKEEQGEVILKLNFLRLIVHEMAHVILRVVLNDMNASTPVVLSNKADKKDLVGEAGVLAEMKLFGSRINWIATTKRSDFNIDYCKCFLESVIKNQKMLFDPDSAKIESYTDTDNPSLMAIDEDPLYDDDDNSVIE